MTHHQQQQQQQQQQQRQHPYGAPVSPREPGPARGAGRHPGRLRKRLLHTATVRTARLVLLAVLAVAVTVGVSAGAARGPAVEVGKVVPAVGSSPLFHNFGAVDVAALSDPANQPGRLRQCQLDGTCYGPDQIRAAYGVQPLLDAGTTGAGRTIVIIDAFGSSTLQSDFDLNNAYWGLPAQTIQVFTPFGIAATTPENALGWKAETTLDVNTAHYVAPDAKIVLVVARSNDDADIVAATRFVADHDLGDVLSQSYGEAEQCMDPKLFAQLHELFEQLTRQGTTLLASAGDNGAAQPSCDGSGLIKAASTPASDPNVTGVGGTDLVATPPTGTLPTSTNAHPSFEVTPGGQYVSESVWNEGVGLAGGGGFSVVYNRPGFQSHAIHGPHARGVPDISYSASVAHAILVIATCLPEEAEACGIVGTFVAGLAGTSAGSPQWAGLVALAAQQANGRLGSINKTLYRKADPADFHDITVSDNSLPTDPDAPGTPITGFAAAPGWDAASGLGTPRADLLVPQLAARAHDND